MSSCEFQQSVQAYHDGELPPEERRRVEDHLSRCPACSLELEEFKRLSKAFASARLPELSDAAAARLHRGGRVVTDRTLLRISEYVAMAAAVMLVVSAAWLWRAQETDTDDLSPSWEDAAVALRSDLAGAEVPQWFVTP